MPKNISASSYPPLNTLRVFDAAARHLNFRLAAEELHVTQGAVAQAVRGLEAALNIKLFARLPRGLALTDEGRAYLTPIQRALKLIADATRELRPQKTVLSISVPPSFATKWLVPRLSEFTKLYPDIDVQIAAGERLANFQSDGVDIAVRQGTAPFGPGLTANLLYQVESFAVCSPSLLAGDPPLKTFEDLSDQVLLHDAHGAWPVFLEKAAGTGSITIHRMLKFNQTALALDAAVAGQGVALANMPLAGADLEAGRLCKPFNLSLEEDFAYYVVAPRSPRNPQGVKRMRDWLLGQSQSGS